VWDGETVVLENPALTGADGKRMLVVVSPRVIRQSVSAVAPNTNAVSVGPSSVTSERSRVEKNVPPTARPKSAKAHPPGAPPRDDTSEVRIEDLTVIIAKAEPYFYRSSKPVGLEELKAEFTRTASIN